MSETPNLSLPYIQPSQAQKHLTHNLALERLDALVHLSVTQLYATEPPAAPADGQVTGVGQGATGAFAGQDGKLAFRSNGAWTFFAPRPGFTAWVEAKGIFYVYDGFWRALQAAGLAEADGLGINTGWDGTNRLAVSSPATLLTHEGGGHRLKVNKAAAGETASLLFQDDFSGRAEMGLAGDDDFSIKVSADGDAWTTALSLDAATGTARLPAVEAASYGGAGVQAHPADIAAGRLMRADWGYGPGNLVGTVAQSDGRPVGAAIEAGGTAQGRYTRWADGTQIVQINRVMVDKLSSNRLLTDVPFPADFVDASYSASLTYRAPVENASTVSYASGATPSSREIGSAFYGNKTVSSLRVWIETIHGGSNFAPGDSMCLDVVVTGRWF